MLSIFPRNSLLHFDSYHFWVQTRRKCCPYFPRNSLLHLINFLGSEEGKMLSSFFMNFFFCNLVFLFSRFRKGGNAVHFFPGTSPGNSILIISGVKRGKCCPFFPGALCCILILIISGFRRGENAVHFVPGSLFCNFTFVIFGFRKGENAVHFSLELLAAFWLLQFLGSEKGKTLSIFPGFFFWKFDFYTL